MSIPIEKKNKIKSQKLASLFYVNNNNIKTWATCDSFCTRVTKVMLEQRMKHNIDTTPIIKVLTKWNRSKIHTCNNNNNAQITNWKQRASCVTFVCLVRRQWFVETCYDFVTHAIHHSNERFVQLGSGGLMRELSTINPNRTIKLLYKDFNLYTFKVELILIIKLLHRVTYLF